MELPSELLAAIDNELTSQSGNKLASLAAELSESYRSGIPFTGNKFIRSSGDVAAYAAYRMPATFAAVYSAVRQVGDRLEAFNPKSLLDIGAGPGTAMWAATALFSDIRSITLLERESFMIDLGKRLSSYSHLASVKEALWKRVDLTTPWEIPPQDLVIASYVLNEISDDMKSVFVQKLWESTGDTLIIIEPGTPAGYRRIMKAREQLIDAGGKTIAPCPHDKACPLNEDNWCHFSMRVARSRLHRKAKGGELSYEDEKFSFVSLSRREGKVTNGIVIRHPQIRKGHISLELCTPAGTSTTVVTKKDKEMFRKARNLDWGSFILEDNKGAGEL